MKLASFRPSASWNFEFVLRFLENLCTPSVEIRLRVKRRRNPSFPVRREGLFGPTQSPISLGAVELFSGGKAAEVMNAWSYISILPYAFMA